MGRVQRRIVAVTLSSCALGLAGQASAQDLGLIFAAGSTSVNGPITPPASGSIPVPATSRTRREGAFVGFFLASPARRAVSMEVDAALSIKGVNLFGGIAASDRMFYLSVPVLVRVTLATIERCPIYALAGPSFGIQAGAANLRTNTDVSGLVKRFDQGFVAGGGALVHDFFLQVRYEWSLRNIAKGAGLLGSGTMKNSALWLAVAIRLG